MLDLLIISAIVLSIGLGYKTKINTGLFGIVAAYFIGVFAMGLQPADIVKMWPISIFFVIFSISMFYNFAIENGTLGTLAQHMLYRTRNHPKALPVVVFLASTFIATLGAGFFAVMAFFAPITMLLCKKSGIHPLIGAIAVNYGALAGNGFLISPGGAVFISLMQGTGVPMDMAYWYEMEIFTASIIVPLVVLWLLQKFMPVQDLGEASTEDTEIRAPKRFNKIQKWTLVLIVGLVFAVLIFPILSALLPWIPEFTSLQNSIDVGMMAMVFTALALFLRLGTEQKLLANVPWGTLLMICGVGMLITLAVKAGTIKLVASLLTNTVPAAIMPIAITLLAGIMGFFSSTMGVIAPALFPLVPMISDESGISAGLLFLAIVMGAQATVISPISSGGSLLMAAVPEKERHQMFGDLLFKAGPICLGASLICVLVMYLI